MLKVNVNDIENVMVFDSDERETTINFSYNEDKATIYTSDNTVITKIKKCMIKDPKQWECCEAGRANDRPTGYFFTTSKSNIRFRSLIEKEKKELTEEERKALGERLWKNRKK